MLKIQFKLVILLFITTEIIHHTKAECCQKAIPLIPNCYSAYGCFEYICADGTPLDKNDSFCGFGACNMFGCGCECRKNSKGYDEEEARRLYRMRFKKQH